ncbi:hypothetical protein P3342_009372 [Pyrenophora teres f. teres]|nr:hypothetical protein HRS9139_08973 [Pyrenophora teres f. teres]KAE8834962.1 hypothetical protein PTNB85_06295 [Pyrenophora teres f. teres]KAE8843562.1 hypothetical protein HRS9122_04665 [Pyrenophora teres f. teres]KAE8856651.1 hypothetical protein PTNB73_09373 [Pyrenophora teres f. teres]KAE8861251.1 hypothetical protein PTNB29_06346 [Pyrenophora teres f. teres]
MELHLFSHAFENRRLDTETMTAYFPIVKVDAEEDGSRPPFLTHTLGWMLDDVGLGCGLFRLLVDAACYWGSPETWLGFNEEKDDD